MMFKNDGGFKAEAKFSNITSRNIYDNIANTTGVTH